jgi:hypothetical protein
MVKTLVIGGLIFGGIGVALSLVAVVCVVSQSGNAHSSIGCNVIATLAYWPSLLVSEREKVFKSFYYIGVNGVGWMLLGIVTTALKWAIRSGPVN